MGQIEIDVYSSGQTIAFRDGKQVLEAQEPWILLYAKHLSSVGIDPTECVIKSNGMRLRIVKAENEFGFNWTIES